MNASRAESVPPSLIERLRAARRVLVLTGAGMSAESGIPTFREAQSGLWEKFRPEDLATPAAFERSPGRVWTWYEERRSRVREARPHAGHRALVELASRVPSLQIVTQNVDGLHQQAGSEGVIELHGNLMRSICHVTGRLIDTDWISQSRDIPPRSPFAENGLARPAVVWFGEVLPPDAINAAVEAAATCDFCFSIGTTSLVQPAASLPLLALEHGACLVEINPRETPLSMHADHCLRGTAAEWLSGLVEQFSNADQEPSDRSRL
jgi:NAD-dependent deacetylase